MIKFDLSHPSVGGYRVFFSPAAIWMEKDWDCDWANKFWGFAHQLALLLRGYSSPRCRAIFCPTPFERNRTLRRALCSN